MRRRWRPFFFISMSPGEWLGIGILWVFLRLLFLPVTLFFHILGLPFRLTNRDSRQIQFFALHQVLNDKAAIYIRGDRKVYVEGISTAGLYEGGQYRLNVRHCGVHSYVDQHGNPHQIEAFAPGSLRASTASRLLIFVLFPFVILIFAINDSKPPAISESGLSSAPLVTKTVAPASILPPPHPSWTLYRGTAGGSYGKDWVIVDGQKIEGIDILLAEHDGIITIVHTGGGVNLPASKMPQHFLNLWGMTPEVLKARDGEPLSKSPP